MKSPHTWIAGLGGILLAGSLLVGCTADGGTTPDPDALSCGAGTGEEATGTPIKFGALVTNQPGLDGFVSATGAAQAYFDCVNANGGIGGHPIDFIVKEDTTDPSAVSTFGTALVEDDQVDGLVSGFSVLDCIVNEQLRAENGYMAIGGGITNECFNSPTFAPVNIGSANSALATAQYLIEQKGVTDLVIVTSNAPGADLINQNAIEYAEANGVTASGLLEDVPIADPQGLALRLTQAVEKGGGVIINFNPGETLKLMNAIEQQGLIDQVVWGCPAGCYSQDLIENLSPGWNHKLFVNTEYNDLASTGPDATLMRDVLAAYAPDVNVDAYAQIGWASANAAVAAILDLPEDQLNKEGINAAFAAATGYESDLLCTPWYYGGLPTKLANNSVRMSDFADGTFSEVSGCTPLPATSINHLDEIRDWEASNGI
jgi:branched-chain amino acid transport system substrate-binding protein